MYGKELAEDKDFTVYDETVMTLQRQLRCCVNRKAFQRYMWLATARRQMMGAIAKEGQPDGCIMMAGPARGFADTLERQYKFLQSLNSEPTEQEKAAFEQGLAAVEQMRNIDSLPEDERIMGQNQTYIKSLLDYDAVKEAADITVPVLVLQGEEDYQVTMDDFRYGKKIMRAVITGSLCPSRDLPIYLQKADMTTALPAIREQNMSPMM